VIAEGVETDLQRKHLMALGCQLGQGFLLGRPVPWEGLLAGDDDVTAEGCC
jgi:diguanylate cyclase